MYGGSANFIKGTGTQNTVTIDWSHETGKYFGFMAVWSNSQTCQTQSDKNDLDFGD